jgi:hypothetical protein
VPVPKDRYYAFADKTPSQNAEIVVIRDNGQIHSMPGTIISVDGERAAEPRLGEVARLWVTPGVHTVGATTCLRLCSLNNSEVKITAQPSRPQYLRIYFGYWVPTVRIEPIERQP